MYILTTYTRTYIALASVPIPETLLAALLAPTLFPRAREAGPLQHTHHLGFSVLYFLESR